MGAVFQMDGYSAHRLTANVQLRVDRQPAADALLTVKVPVVLLRQADHACPADRPAGKDCVAVEAFCIFVVYQFDKLQAPGIVQTKCLRQLSGGVLVAGTGAAVVQLVGEDHIKRLNIRAVPEKFLNFRQVDAPLHIEHQDAQGLWNLCGRRNKIVGFCLRELGDHGHDLCLRSGVQQSAQTLALFKRNPLHDMLLFHILRQEERIISSGCKISVV